MSDLERMLDHWPVHLTIWLAVLAVAIWGSRWVLHRPWRPWLKGAAALTGSATLGLCAARAAEIWLHRIDPVRDIAQHQIDDGAALVFVPLLILGQVGEALKHLGPTLITGGVATAISALVFLVTLLRRR